MSVHPWIKFYPADWRSDPKLRMCSLAARGLWMEMLALMHEASPYGHLLISGRAPTDAQLAVLAGAPSDQIPDLLGELDAAGVFSRTREGAIYSRRMVRDQKRAQEGRKHVKKRWDQVSENKDTIAQPNREPISHPSPQIPEARSQKEKNGADFFFEAFWKAYPKHRRDGSLISMSKPKAHTAWSRALKSGATHEDLRRALELYETELELDQWRHPAHAATWLNDGRWRALLEEDQPKPATLSEDEKRAMRIAAGVEDAAA